MIRGVTLMLLVMCAQPAAAHTDIETQLASVNLNLESRPNDSSLYIRRGELKRHVQDWLGAEADFARADQLGSTEIRDQLNLYRGRLFEESGQARRAVAELDVFISRHPEHLDALRTRALAHAQMGEVNEAITDYSQVIALDSSRNPELWLERARLWMESERIDVAVASIDEAIAIFGPLIVLIEFAVDAEVARHEYSAALDRIEELPPVLAESPKWLWRRGLILEKMDRPAAAARTYARAHEAISNLPLVRQKTAAMQDLLEKLRAHNQN